MLRPLSMDLRKRIVEAVNAGLSRSAAARRFAVAPSSAIKLMQAKTQTGSLAPKQMGGHRKKVKDEIDWVLRGCHALAWDALKEDMS